MKLNMVSFLTSLGHILRSHWLSSESCGNEQLYFLVSSYLIQLSLCVIIKIHKIIYIYITVPVIKGDNLATILVNCQCC